VLSNLLVGNNSNDDAAVYDLSNGSALLVTADFFMPIVDDAYTFGQVAAANSLSDVYAMGGKPITAIALLGWPIDKLSAQLASEVMAGARKVCEEAGVVISGGHTIDSVEPFFGLSVNGIVAVENVKRNSTARVGDVLMMSKALGVGILATAQKRGVLDADHVSVLTNQLTQLNKIGEILGKETGVSSMTDITGFGLAGHLSEMCDGAGVSAKINFSKIPVMPETKIYIDQNILPDATYRNWNAYQNNLGIDAAVDQKSAFMLLPDPQTNGGLLFTVQPDQVEHLIALGIANNTPLHIIGEIIEKEEKKIYVGE
jgi:selenide,water dikinase